MAPNKPEKGDKVSWNWGGGAPGGTVVEKKTEGEVAIKSKKGNTIKKNAEPDNPAVHIARSGNDVVKKASELTVEEKNAESQNNKKRKANKEESKESSEEEGSDVHTLNEDGKEVKKGGKGANKKQKREQDEDSQTETHDGEDDEEAAEEEQIVEENEESDTSDEKEEDKINEEKKRQRPISKANGAHDKSDGKSKSNNTTDHESEGKGSTKDRKGPKSVRERDDTVSSRTRSQEKK
ncbi:hypothetical protein F4810DRAFT_687600 [Camillea tinctor]|nr:hypothetical protein F4810DRAFT_687600 [Camillea tinctor]